MISRLYPVTKVTSIKKTALISLSVESNCLQVADPVTDGCLERYLFNRNVAKMLG